MNDTNIEFQLIFFFASGLIFGGITKHIFYMIAFILIYEFFIFHLSRFYPPNVKQFDRVLLNLVYFMGWILGRVLILNETGLEDIVEEFNKL